jgi:trans-aconitate 2-methyltransferase
MPFEFDAAKYAKASQPQREWGDKLIAELSLSGGERVLDLGCGDGAVTARLAELVPNGQVVGIDSSQSMITAARQRERSNLRFVQMDINALSLDDRFELIFSNATLHWVLDHAPLLANVYGHLSAGGVARFNFAGDGNCRHYFPAVRAVMELPEFRGYFEDFTWPYYMPTIEQYQALVAESPLQEFEVWGENADRYFPDADAMAGWIDQPSIVPFLSRVPEAGKRDFRDAVVQRTLAAAQQPDGTYFETFRRINLRAWK